MIEDAGENGQEGTTTEGDVFVGSRVQACFLKSAPELNGEVGTVLRWISEKGRWEIQFDNGRKQLVRPPNLQVMKVAGLQIKPTLVHIVSLSGKVTDFMADSSWTMLEVKEALEPRVDVPAPMLRLFLEARELSNTEVLGDLPSASMGPIYLSWLKVAIQVGQTVSVISHIQCDGFVATPCSMGRVMEIDEKGDATVRFQDKGALTSVLKQDFGKLQPQPMLPEEVNRLLDELNLFTVMERIELPLACFEKDGVIFPVNRGYYALHIAAGLGSVQLTKELLALRADVNARGYDGKSPLRCAETEFIATTSLAQDRRVALRSVIALLVQNGATRT